MVNAQSEGITDRTVEPGTGGQVVPGSGDRGLALKSAIYLLSNVLAAAVPFALLPVLTRYLNPSEYGQVAMFQTLVAALAPITGFNVVGAATRKYYDAGVSDTAMAYFIGSCLQILLVSTLLALGAVLSFQMELAGWLGLEPQWVPWAVIIAAANFVYMLRLGQCQVRGQATKYGIMQVSMAIANMSLSVLFVVVLLYGAAGRISAQTIVMLLFAALGLWLLAKDGLLSLKARAEYLKEALKFGVPLIPHVSGIFLLSAVDRIVINSELGLGPTGIYMVAVQLSMGMAIVFDAINKAYVPWLFERLVRDEPSEKQQIVRYTYAYFVVVLVAAGAAFIIGPWLVVLIAGERYAPAAEVIGWLALGQAFNGMYLMVTNYIFFSKQTGLLSFASISAGLLNLGLLVILTRIMGLKGAAIAFAISMLVRFLLTWSIAQKRHPMPWFNSSNHVIPKVQA